MQTLNAIGLMHSLTASQGLPVAFAPSLDPKGPVIPGERVPPRPRFANSSMTLTLGLTMLSPQPSPLSFIKDIHPALSTWPRTFHAILIFGPWLRWGSLVKGGVYLESPMKGSS